MFMIRSTLGRFCNVLLSDPNYIAQNYLDIAKNCEKFPKLLEAEVSITQELLPGFL